MSEMDEMLYMAQCLKIEHEIADDCRQSCPKAESCDFDRGTTECWCGADKHNARVDTLMAKIRAMFEVEA